MKQSATDPQTGRIDLGMITTGQSSATRQRRHDMAKALKVKGIHRHLRHSKGNSNDTHMALKDTQRKLNGHSMNRQNIYGHSKTLKGHFKVH